MTSEQSRGKENQYSIEWKLHITLQRAFGIHCSTSMDSTSPGLCGTVVHISENNPHLSEPIYFKLVLFKGQLYSFKIRKEKLFLKDRAADLANLTRDTKPFWVPSCCKLRLGCWSRFSIITPARLVRRYAFPEFTHASHGAHCHMRLSVPLWANQVWRIQSLF